MRAAILTGAGKAFVAGADIAAMVEMTPLEAKRFSWLGHVAFARIEELHFPVIAAVNGFALGGGLELALACDFIVAADTAKFGQPEVTLAVIPGFGGSQRLPRRVGVAGARAPLHGRSHRRRAGAGDRPREPDRPRGRARPPRATSR